MTPLMRSAFSHDAETRAALAEFVLTSDRLSMGPMVAEFERKFSAHQGRAHGVMTNSGGSANLLLVQAMLNIGDLHPGQEVHVSAVTWSTNVMPIMQLGMVPVPADVCVETLNIADDISYDTVFATNALGFCGNLDDIEANSLLLVDSCEGVGGELDGKQIGAFGTASTFSFFVGHHLSTIEGGMVLTDDAELADALRMARANGWDRDVSGACRDAMKGCHGVNDFDSAYTFYAPAFNVRPTEIQGFLGLIQIQYLDDNCARRAEIYERLSDAQGFGVRIKSRMSKISPLAYPIVCEEPSEARERRDRFVAAGVEVRPLISGNIARQPFFPESAWSEDHMLPGAEHLSECAFYCGLHPEMTEEELTTIERCLR